MKRIAFALASIACLMCFAAPSHAAGQYYKVDYTTSTAPNELQIPVTYSLWIPDGAKTLRGIIVHQHGAGLIAARAGVTGAYDLHWQALAKKWDCALMSPSYHVSNDRTDVAPGAAQLWFDPRRGSDKAFLKALTELAAQSGHPEIDTVPWVLWGHSGGAVWADSMAILHPNRIAVIFLRSGAASLYRKRWGAGFPELQVPEGVYAIPYMSNPGVQEMTPKNTVGQAAITVFNEYRAKGAPIGFAPDPLTAHWCGNSRYFAIPYIDACLALRLPDKGSKDQTLKPIDQSKGWLAPLNGDTAVPAADYKGDLKESVWLPSEVVAKDWMEYVKTGGVSDTTPPPAPTNLKTKDLGDRGTEITWDAEADFESGIRNFIILRDGQELGNLPAINLIRHTTRPMFQAGFRYSYNDSPNDPVPEMRFVDPWPKDNLKHTWGVITVNTVELKSEPVSVSAQYRATPTEQKIRKSID